MKQRVLVLEDDKTSRKLIASILEKYGYDVITCSEGRDAIHIALMNPPEAILVDVMLPDMSGTDVVDELSRHESCKYMKAIFLTGILSKKADDPKLKYLFDIEGNQYKALAKPVKKSLLLNTLVDAIAEAEAEKAKDEAEKTIEEIVSESKEAAEEATAEEEVKSAEEAKADTEVSA